METNLFFKGMALGFAIAAPVGPIGILCIQRTVQFGRLSGLFSGLGAATADVVYAIIAAFGLTFVSNFLIAEQFWLQVIGGCFLFYMGWKTFCAPVVRKSSGVAHSTLFNDFISTFLLTLTNPMTILSFIAIFAGLGLSYVEGDYFNATVLVSGIFLGSATWWLLLSEGITLFRQKVSEELMHWINRIAGCVIALFGAVALLTCCFLKS